MFPPFFVSSLSNLQPMSIAQLLRSISHCNGALSKTKYGPTLPRLLRRAQCQGNSCSAASAPPTTRPLCPFWPHAVALLRRPWSTRSPDVEVEEEVTEAEAADGEVVEAVVAGGWKGKKPGRQPWARPHPSTSSTQGSLITLRVTLCYNRDTRDTRDTPPCDLT